MEKKVIVTIGRQTGSGGRLVAKKLAEELNIPYYDKEVLEEAAKNSGFSKEFLEKNDEKTPNSLLYAFAMNTYAYGGIGEELPVGTKLYLAQFEAVKSVAAKGSCVLVGRCADYFLRDEEGLVRVFISADYKDRLFHIAKAKGLKEKEAREIIKKRDKSRAAYYDFNTDGKWGSASNYDLCLNTTRLGIDGCVEMIKKFIEIKKDGHRM